ncbi:MAG: SEC-C metal-binding domain-containing protein [Gemmataceae bacterium]
MDHAAENATDHQTWQPSNQPTRYDRARVARFRPIKEAVDALGLPPIRLRKLRGILGAVEMQIEDGGDHPKVNRILLDALRAALVHHVGQDQAQVVLQAIKLFEDQENERWELIRAGNPPPLDLTTEEKIGDLIDAGSQLSDACRFPEACDKWLEAWELVRTLVRPEMRSFEQVIEVYPELPANIFGWRSRLIGDLDWAGDTNRIYHEHRLSLARECLALFPDDGVEGKVFFGLAEGEALWKVGRRQEAEAVYAALERECPDEALAYIGWADRYLEADADWNGAKAAAILNRALARPNLRHRGEILNRLDELRGRHEKLKSKEPVSITSSSSMLPPVSQPRRVGRNEPCWCGSGKKFKHCHLRQ